MTTYWCEHATLPTGTVAGVRLTIEGDRIASIQRRAQADVADVRLPGVTMPGLANAHSHVFHRGLRARTHGAGFDFFQWRERMYALMGRLDPENFHALARATFAEMALAGITLVGEFHHVHHDRKGKPYGDRNAMGLALKLAAEEAGIRLTLIDTVYLAGGLDGTGYLPPSGTQKRFSDKDVDRWASRVQALPETAMLRLGAGIHSVRAVPRDQLAQVAEVARSRVGGTRTHDVPLHAHVSEALSENAATQACYGLTPAQLLAEEGVLGPHTTAIHATHVDEAEVRLLGRSGTGVCLCPTTQCDLADGLGPTAQLRQAGVPTCLGTDQHVHIDMWQEMQALELYERVRSGERGQLAPLELVHMATEQGYRALGWPEGGRLEVGALADFQSVRLDSVRTVGSKPAQVLHSAAAFDVDTVVVGGRCIVEGGRHRLGSIALQLRLALDNLTDEG